VADETTNKPAAPDQTDVMVTDGEMLVDVFTWALVQHSLEDGVVLATPIKLPSGQVAALAIVTGVDAVRGFLALIETMARASGAQRYTQVVRTDVLPS